jgi:hypothetical protein
MSKCHTASYAHAADTRLLNLMTSNRPSTLRHVAGHVSTEHSGSRCTAVSPDAQPWVAAPRRGRLARDPLQISETALDPVIDLVRHSRSANCGCESTPAATAKDTQRARVRAHRYGYSYRNAECKSGAEQHFRDHQMPNRSSRRQVPDWSRYMWRFHCPIRRASRRCSHLSNRSINLSSILSMPSTVQRLATGVQDRPLIVR